MSYASLHLNKTEGEINKEEHLTSWLSISSLVNERDQGQQA